MSGRGGADRAEDLRRGLVVPVVEDRRQQVDVAFRDSLEEAARYEFEAVVEERLVSRRLRQVEDDPAQVGVGLQQLGKERAVAAAYVDDGFAAAPLDRLQPLDPRVRSLRHRPVEPRPLLRMLGEPRPEVGAEDLGEDRLSACVEPLDRAVPHASEEHGEIVPAARQQELGRRGVAENASFLLGEDALARERTE